MASDEAWPPPEGFPERLFRLRRAKGVDNAAIAAAAGVHVRTVSNWIGGQVPEGKPLFALARYFGVPAEWLIGAEQERRRPPVKREPETPPKALQTKKRRRDADGP